MEIKLDGNIEAVRPRLDAPAKARPAPAASDSARFEGSDSLDQALQGTPAARPGAVAHARDVIGDVAYPPRETIQQIAALLALHLGTDDAATQQVGKEPNGGS